MLIKISLTKNLLLKWLKTPKNLNIDQIQT
jgi:hypothetical protein